MPHPLDRPLTRQKQRVVERANRLRGMLVGSYSQVEYLIGNLWVSMENIQPYLTNRSNFPYRQKSRIAAVRTLFGVTRGPLFKFSNRAVKLLEEMDNHELHRHMMAHGYMEVFSPSRGEYSIRVRFYRPSTSDKANEVHATMTLNKLEADANKASDFCSRWMKLHFDIHADLGWIAPATSLLSHDSNGVVMQTGRD